MESKDHQQEQKVRKLRKPKFITVDQLKPGVHGYNVFVLVHSVQMEETTRANGDKLKIATCCIGDETACINARITGENADKMIEGSVLAFRNGRSVVFQEHMRLEIDRWGKISAEDDEVLQDKSKCDPGAKNMSDTSYETKIVQVKGGRGGNRGDNRRK